MIQSKSVTSPSCLAAQSSSVTSSLCSLPCPSRRSGRHAKCGPEFFTFLYLIVCLCVLVSSTILEEEKLQQKERNRMEMRRQVTVSWDSGGSDEAPPKVRNPLFSCLLASCGAPTFFFSILIVAFVASRGRKHRKSCELLSCAPPASIFSIFNVASDINLWLFQNTRH